MEEYPHRPHKWGENKASWRKGRGHADPAPATSARSAGSFWDFERAFQKSDFSQKGVAE